MDVTAWRLEMDGPRAVALLPVWVKDLVMRWRWRLDVRGWVVSETGVRLRDLVTNAPEGSEVTASYSPARLGRVGAWDWRTLELVRRNGPGFCLSRYRYVYREASGAWGLWLPVGGCLRYFGAFGGEDEAACAANRLGPKWCAAVFRVERVERRAGGIKPARVAVASPTNGGPARTRETVCRIEWADGRVEFVEPADL